MSIQVMSEIVNRAQLAAQMGMQSFGGDRDMNIALGYPLTLTYRDYLARWTRQDIAKAIINRPVKFTWQGDLRLIESGDDKETPFEKAWEELEKNLHLKSRFIRVDKLSGLGTYGLLLLGLNDVKKPEDWAQAAVGARKLLYVKPFGQGSVQIKEFESNTADPRYGLPKIYGVTISNVTSGTNLTQSSSTIEVHYTRVIHVMEEAMESEIEGTPRLEAVFNRLMDIEKLVGGDAEMFWKGARPGYAGNVDKDYQLTSGTKDDLKDQIDEYEHGLRRVLINQGIDFKALAQQIADPATHVDVQIQMISAETGIPKRILTGSERGELSSGQDSDEIKTYIQNRRMDHAFPNILQPFIERCIELKILPKPGTGSYEVDWSDLFAPSEKEKVAIGKERSAALKEYTGNTIAQTIVPPVAFMEFFLGFNANQIELIGEMIKEDMNTERPVTPEEQAALDAEDDEDDSLNGNPKPAKKADSIVKE